MPGFDHRAVPIALAALMIDIIGFGIVMPVLPGLITALGHVDLPRATEIGGWMLAAFAAAQFVAGPIVGTLGDRFGRRPVLLLSMTAFAIDYALMAWSPTLGWLFVGRVIAGLSGALFGPVGAVIADTTPPERRARAFGLIGAAFGVGFIVGPALGGIVAGLGLRAPFVLAAALAAINAVTMFFLLPETLARENRRAFRLADAHVVGAFRPLFDAGNATWLLVAWFLWQVGGIVYPAVWSFWAAIRLGWDAQAIGWSLAWVGFLTILVQIGLTSRVVAALGERATAVIAAFAGAACLTGYAFATQGWQVYAFFMVGALGQMGWPAMNGLLSRLVDATRQGALQGGIGSMNAVAQVIGPLIAAQALAIGTAHAFPGAAFLVSAILVCASGVIILVGTAHLGTRNAAAGAVP